ncbi:hypothetical protein GCM10009629_36250 [Pseudonocardia alni]
MSVSSPVWSTPPPSGTLRRLPRWRSPHHPSSTPGGPPMKKAGRKLSKAAESFVEAIGILGGWNRGRRRSRPRR